MATRVVKNTRNWQHDIAQLVPQIQDCDTVIVPTEDAKKFLLGQLKQYGKSEYYLLISVEAR